MENTTRISDLPDNISIEIGESTHSNMHANMHSQMNIHPNPYLSQKPALDAEIPRMPKEMPPQAHYHNPAMTEMPKQRLPSRDIPMDSTQYTQDVQITPNYIPPATVGTDYVRDREILTKEKLRQHEEKKSRLDKIDLVLTEFQTPVFIMLLFFLFQLPVVNTMIFKKFSFLSIVNDDGNFNTFGLACKSVLFGSLFYTVSKFTNYIIEL